MKKISFIHAADLHLDSPMVGLRALPANIFTRVRESTFTALKKLTVEAISRNVDFVIIAGDIFDGEDRSLMAQSRFRTEMLKLAEKEIPVYVVHGNHDHLNGSWVQLGLPENVHIFNSTVEMKALQTKSGITVHLYGFSYPVRHVFDKKIADYQKVEGADFHIGILHGNLSGGEEHDNYAPFTIRELEEKQFDYWALGHIHKRKILSEYPPIVYPGNIQGRNRKEKDVKGFYHVTLSEIEAKMNFVEASDIIWEEAAIDSSLASNFHEILQLCQAELNRVRKDKSGTFLTLFLENVQINDAREKRSLDGELLELLLEDEKEEESFVWLVDLIIRENIQIDKEQLISEANFYAELFRTAEGFSDTASVISSLYEHRLGRKYLSFQSDKDQKELIEKAEQLLIKLLYQE